jgi:large subunit ribosomal protein L3
MEIQGIIGKKLGMTQYFSEDGSVIPVTVVQAGPCYVIQIKKEETDGYNAVQLGFEPQKMQRVTKPLLGHFKNAGKGTYKYLKEFYVNNPDEFELGQEISVDKIFSAKEFIHATGITKGRGFTGVVKRYNFAGGRASHGSKVHRTPGGIGASAWPSRVIKNKKMPGQYGNEKKTIKNLQIIDIRPEENLILIKGALPGHKNSIVFLKKQFF